MVSEPPCLNQLYQQGSHRIDTFVPIHTNTAAGARCASYSRGGHVGQEESAFRVATPGSTTPARGSAHWHLHSCLHKSSNRSTLCKWQWMILGTSSAHLSSASAIPIFHMKPNNGLDLMISNTVEHTVIIEGGGVCPINLFMLRQKVYLGVGRRGRGGGMWRITMKLCH